MTFDGSKLGADRTDARADVQSRQCAQVAEVEVIPRSWGARVAELAIVEP